MELDRELAPENIEESCDKVNVRQDSFSVLWLLVDQTIEDGQQLF